MKSHSRWGHPATAHRLERARLADWLLRSPDNVRRLLEGHTKCMDLDLETLDRGKQVDLSGVIARVSTELVMGHEPSNRSELHWDSSGYPQVGTDRRPERPHPQAIPFRPRRR